MELERQRAQLTATIGWAQKLRATLQPILDAHGDRVHFRPASGGVAMVSVLHHRPQRGKSGLRDLRRVANNFEELFRQHCVEIDHGRVTGEEELQSFLIRQSYRYGRMMQPLVDAAKANGEELDLLFVTDEQLLPVGTDRSKVVCDLLAVRRDPERGLIPVLLELKDSRDMTRLIAQVESFATLIDLHADLFAQLYTALLGFEVRFGGPTEKWIVWPALGQKADPREAELRARGIRVAGYDRDGESFRLRLGSGKGAFP
jgi:hypothetical protein